MVVRTCATYLAGLLFEQFMDEVQIRVTSGKNVLLYWILR